MREIDFDNLKSSDLVSVEVLVERFKEYLKKELDYSDIEAEIGAFDMNNPYTAQFINQDSEGKIEIDGVKYEVRYCYTDFCLCGLFHLADIKPFEFYMFFDTSAMKDQTVGSYIKADKKFVVLD